MFKNNYVRRILLGVLLFAILVSSADFALNRICYNPYRDYEANAKVFSLLAETNIPIASRAYVSPYRPGTPRHFSRFSQAFFIERESFQSDKHNSPLLAQGELTYGFGTVSHSLTIDSKEKRIFRQQDFLSPEPTAQTPDDDAYYVAVVACPDGTLYSEAMEFYDTLAAADRQHTLVKTIRQSSDHPADIALGFAGDGAYFLLDQGGYRAGATPKERELAFYNNLRYLADHPRETEIFYQSGLFGDTPIDYAARLEYLKENAPICIGLVVFAKGDALTKWAADNRLPIICLIQN